MKFETTSRNIPRNHYKYRFRSVLAKESRSYPRDVVAGVATKRGPALLLAARSGVRRLAHTPAHWWAGCGLALLHHKVSRS